MVRVDRDYTDDALNEEPAFSGVPKGKPGIGTRPDVGTNDWDTAYARELLGREFIGTKETFRETEVYYRNRGWSFLAKACADQDRTR
jgi:hypothetical protein